MNYQEIKGDLFKVSKEYFLVHCISQDCKMGVGIAVEFVKRNPNMRNTLQKMNPKIGDALYYNLEGKHGVINLITKERYFNKPIREDFNKSIVDLKMLALSYDIKKLAMPLIGSGLDRLSWKESSKFIQETFADTDIEILVVKL